MTFKLVLFDLDDTLCDYAAAREVRLRIAFARAFAEIGPATAVDLDEIVAESIKIQPHGSEHFGELLARFGLHDLGAVERSRHWYQTNRFHALKLFPDALEILRLTRSALQVRKIGLITNGPADVQRGKVELLELEPWVDFVLISGEFGSAKPDAAIFREALRLGGATERETILIGDSPEFDIVGAQRMGIPTVWVNRTGGPWALDGIRPDYEVESLTALIPLLSNCSNETP